MTRKDKLCNEVLLRALLDRPCRCISRRQSHGNYSGVSCYEYFTSPGKFQELLQERREFAALHKLDQDQVVHLCRLKMKLILSYLILSYLILSYLILSYPILSYLILSYLIVSYLIVSHLISSHLILLHLILSYHILSYQILS